MVPLSMHDLKGGFFLIASFVMLALICGIGHGDAASTVVRAANKALDLRPAI